LINLFILFTLIIFAGGTPSIYMALNSAIHVLMYMYYLFTGIGMGKALAPWKKYLTIIQMVKAKVQNK